MGVIKGDTGIFHYSSHVYELRSAAGHGRNLDMAASRSRRRFQPQAL